MHIACSEETRKLHANFSRSKCGKFTQSYSKDFDYDEYGGYYRSCVPSLSITSQILVKHYLNVNIVVTVLSYHG